MYEVCSARYRRGGIQTILDVETRRRDTNTFDCIGIGNRITIRLLYNIGFQPIPIELRYIVKQGWKAEWIRKLLKSLEFSAYNILTMILYGGMDKYILNHHFFSLLSIDNFIFDQLNQGLVLKRCDKWIEAINDGSDFKIDLEHVIATGKYVIIRRYLQKYAGSVIEVAMELNRSDVLEKLNISKLNYRNISWIPELRSSYKNNETQLVRKAVITENWQVLSNFASHFPLTIVDFAAKLNKPNVIKWLQEFYNKGGHEPDYDSITYTGWTGTIEVKYAMYELLQGKSPWTYQLILDAADAGKSAMIYSVIPGLNRYSVRNIEKDVLPKVLLTCESEATRKSLRNYLSNRG